MTTGMVERPVVRRRAEFARSSAWTVAHLIDDQKDHLTALDLSMLLLGLLAANEVPVDRDAT